MALLGPDIHNQGQFIKIDPTHPYSDFRNFLYAVWMHLGLPDPTPVQYDIAYNLQHGPKRLIIEAYRGCGKSFILATYAVWLLYWDQNHRIMVVSAGQDRANAFSQFCLRLIYDMPELSFLIPRAEQRRSLIAFEVNGATVDQSPSVKSVGITGQLTGSRADTIMADDVETPKNSQTMIQREKLRELVKEFDAVLKPLPTSRIVYLGTPQCEDSLYNHVAQRGYETLIWPARKPAPSDLEKYEGKLAQYIIDLPIPAGSPVDPDRFDEEDLTQREASYGRTGFALQFMLDTSMSDALRFPLKCSDLVVMDVDREVGPIQVTYGSSPDQLVTDIDCVGLKGDRLYGPMYVSDQHVEYEGAMMYIDPSGRGADRTTLAVTKFLGGRIFLRRAVSLAGGYDEQTLGMIAHIARAEKVNVVQVEPNFGDGMFLQLLRPFMARIHPCTVEDAPWNNRQKEVRIIDTLEPVMNQHRLIVDKAIFRNDLGLDQDHQLFYQMTRITRDRGALGHDDLLDAVTGAVAYWTDRIDADTEQTEDKYKQELWDREVERFLERHDKQYRRGAWNWGERGRR